MERDTKLLSLYNSNVCFDFKFNPGDVNHSVVVSTFFNIVLQFVLEKNNVHKLIITNFII